MKPVTAELLTIGDEILYGQIVDTNSQWMGSELGNIGVRVIRKTSVGDEEGAILTAFAEAESRADIVLITGGLGPTSDDLTKPCLAKYFGCEIRMNDEALAHLTEFFKSRGRELTETNRMQAALPVCCEMIPNNAGTAAGMWFERNRKVFVSMPGVPHEMKRMMTESVLPRLKHKFRMPAIHHTIIRTVGIGESFLADKISAWEKSLPDHMKLAYLPGIGDVKLRLTAFGTDLAQIAEEASAQVEKLKPFAAEYIFGVGDDPLEAVLGAMLREHKLTIAAAESCTGGFVSHMITSGPGSSDYFLGGIVAYDNRIKVEQLGIDEKILTEKGAVSEETVIAMAYAVRNKFGSDIGVSSSGIAGPSGGTPEKPVGTVWIACADRNGAVARKLQLSKDRMINIRLSSVAVLNLVRLHLKGQP